MEKVDTAAGRDGVPAEGDKPVDTTGAGNAFVGGFLYCLSQSGKHHEELTLKEVTDFSHFAANVAGICIGRRASINAMPLAFGNRRKKLRSNS